MLETWSQVCWKSLKSWIPVTNDGSPYRGQDGHSLLFPLPPGTQRDRLELPRVLANGEFTRNTCVFIAFFTSNDAVTGLRYTLRNMLLLLLSEVSRQSALTRVCLRGPQVPS